MKIKIDIALCQGHSVCLGEAPEVFDVIEQDDGYPLVKDVASASIFFNISKINGGSSASRIDIVSVPLGGR